MSNIKVKKNGIEYISNYRQFVCVSNAKYIIIGNQIFLKNGKRNVAIKNVANIEKIDDKLYFTGFGKVEILFDNVSYYKYFNVLIFSDKFDLCVLRQEAITDMINNPLNFESKKNFSHFMKIVKGIFRLNFESNKLEVKANGYFLPFKMIYKLNGKIRKVNFNFN